MSGGLGLTEGGAILIVILVGFLPTEIWRSLAIVAGRRIPEGSAVFHWVRAVATALLAAVVARLVLAPSGVLVDVPLAMRLGAVGAGLAVFLATRHSMFFGILAGELVIVAALLFSGR